MPLSAGIQLGPYEILGPLGAGGMGEVYRARDTRLDRDVAIKVLPAALINDAAALARFEREAKAVAALSHPNILAVHDFGESGGTRYAVMELLEGESLRQRLSEGPLPPRKAVEIGREVALGLAAAHEKGIVHRDLKPENLFLTLDGRVKILDFGLARQLSLPTSSDTQSPTVAQLSEPGLVLGTVGYMAPEQLRGQPADFRCDIFSFGAVLYEMLAGRRAFQSDTSIETMNAILKEDPPELSRSDRPVPPALERIVAHCLEKRPDERFQSARDLAFDLGSLSTSTPAGGLAAARSRTDWRRRLAFAVASTLGLIAAFFVGSRVSSRDRGGSVTFRRLTFRRGNLLSARFAPDGKTVVYGAAWEGKPSELFSVRTDSVESRPLGLDRADVLDISPRGELAIKTRKGSFQAPDGAGTLARMPLGGGAARELEEGIIGAAWAPNGEDIAVLRQTPEGKYRIEWPIGHLLYESYFIIWPRVEMSPDGNQIAFAESNNAAQKAIWVVDRQGKRRPLTEGWATLRGFSWSQKTGELFFLGARTRGEEALWAVSPSGRKRALWHAAPGFTLHDVAPDGRLLLERGANRRGVIWMGPGATQEKELGWLDGTDVKRLSRDGSTILFDEVGEGEGSRQGVYTRPTAGGPAIRLGDGDPQEFSPDGKWVLTIASGSPSELLLLPTGPGTPRRIPAQGLNPVLAFMPNEKTLSVLSSTPGQPFQAYTLDVNGGLPKLVSLPGINWDAHGAFARDNSLVAYSTTDRRILLGTLGGAPHAIPGASLGPGEYITVFSPDMKYLQTQTDSEIPARIFQTDLKTGAKTLWKEIEPTDRTGIIWIDEAHFNRDQTAYAYGYNRIESSDLYVVEGLQ
jgi:hypothetical protein